MKKGWRVILIIVVVCIALGAVCAGVGMLTGAEPDRVSALLENRVEEKYNIDPNALIHEWVPSVIDIFRDTLAG